MKKLILGLIILLSLTAPTSTFAETESFGADVTVTVVGRYTEDFIKEQEFKGILDTPEYVTAEFKRSELYFTEDIAVVLYNEEKIISLCENPDLHLAARRYVVVPFDKENMTAEDIKIALNKMEETKKSDAVLWLIVGLIPILFATIVVSVGTKK